MALRLSRTSSSALECQIVLLDNTEFETVFVKNSVLGIEIFDIVCNKLNIPPSDKKYFGLRFTDREDGELNWLNLGKEIPSASKSEFINYQFQFQVFPSEPSKVSPVVTDLLRHQIKDFINRGKLKCPPNKQAILDGYFAQATLGDYNHKVHTKGYFEDLLGSFFVCPSGINCAMEVRKTDYEAMVTKLHKSHRGMTSHDASFAYVKESQHLPLYGMFLHKRAHDMNGKNVTLGVCERGIYVFETDKFDEPGNIKNHFVWQDIVTTLCDTKKGKFHIVLEQMGQSQTHTFKFSNGHFSHKAANRMLVDALNHQEMTFSDVDRQGRLYQRSKSEQVESSTLLVEPGQRDRIGSSPFLTPQMNFKKYMPSFKRVASSRR